MQPVNLQDITACLNHQRLNDGLWSARAEDGLKPAAVLVPLHGEPSQLQLLLTRRAGHLKHHSGQVSFPGGRYERADRHILNAALRETQEEVGIGVEHIDVLGHLDGQRSISGFNVTPFVAALKPGFQCVPEPGEVDEIFSVPFDFFMQPDNQKKQKIRTPRGDLQYHVFHYEGHNIWGLTAAIIMQLVKRLQGINA